jgi:hypothetical protein
VSLSWKRAKDGPLSGINGMGFPPIQLFLPSSIGFRFRYLRGNCLKCAL